MQEYKLEQPLVTHNISNIYKQLFRLIKKYKQLKLDLSVIKNIDSSGLALLLELKSMAAKEKCNLSINTDNHIIMRLCQLYKVNL